MCLMPGMHGLYDDYLYVCFQILSKIDVFRHHQIMILCLIFLYETANFVNFIVRSGKGLRVNCGAFLQKR